MAQKIAIAQHNHICYLYFITKQGYTSDPFAVVHYTQIHLFYKDLALTKLTIEYPKTV
jgi:hypothetical protein